MSSAGIRTRYCMMMMDHGGQAYCTYRTICSNIFPIWHLIFWRVVGSKVVRRSGELNSVLKVISLCVVSISTHRPISVTRLGRIPPLWWNVKIFGKTFKHLFTIWRNFEPSMANFYTLLGQFFCVSKGQDWTNPLSIWLHCYLPTYLGSNEIDRESPRCHYYNRIVYRRRETRRMQIKTFKSWDVSWAGVVIEAEPQGSRLA